MSTQITYGLGGYNPVHPNGNKVEEVVDNGDGTGVRTVYNGDGTVASTQNLTGLPVAQDDQAQQVLAVLAQLSPEQLQRVVTLGVMVTEPDAVDTLVTSVAPGGDLADGVAVVAEAASTALASTEG